MKTALLAGLLLLTLTSPAVADTSLARFTSPDLPVDLVELFTSEGCSSCPPAERWLGDLTKQPGLWTEFIPLAFHVDYWDYIGWRDRFASSAHSQRQRRYAREGGLQTVYTPGVLLNGQEWRAWYRSPRPENARRNSSSGGQLSLELDDGSVRIAYLAPASAGGKLDVHVALLGMGLKTNVQAGENDGRVLRHEFVVLGMTSAALDASGQRHAAQLPLPGGIQEAPRYALAAWVSEAGQQAPLQAVGGYLDFSP